MRHLHAGDHRLLADIEMAEAADIAHAVELPGLLLESADEQHQAIGGKLLLRARLGAAGSSAPARRLRSRRARDWRRRA